MRQKSTKTKRDQYLRRKFEITEAEYNKQFEKQGKVCICCGRLPITKSLSVDHDHAIERWKIDAKKEIDGRWYAWPKGYRPSTDSKSGPMVFYEFGKTKSEAKAKVKKRLKKISIRGILCVHCNRGLRYYNDSPVRMREAARYLQGYYDYLDGTLPTHPNFGGLE